MQTFQNDSPVPSGLTASLAGGTVYEEFRTNESPDTTMPLPLPTHSELAILQVLWERGPSSVRDVQQALESPVGYTGVLKLLQLMSAKGLVRRDESGRAHQYQAAEPRAETQARLVRRLADRAFGGSTVSLVMRALSDERASPEELRRIRELLDRADGTAQ
jgi:BlaI family transcriptional regulator, penicillinase repressor